MKRIFAILLLAAALQTGLPAKVTLPSFFSDNMVLQQKQDVAVCYCFRNWCRGTLFNSYGIPALPFRSDDWPLN